MEKNICSRCVIGESVKYHSRRGFLVPGNTTLWLRETDIGVCRHNLQGELVSFLQMCVGLRWIRACKGKDLGQASILSLNQCCIGSHSMFSYTRQITFRQEEMNIGVCRQ